MAAAKGNQYAKGNRGGARPTKYDPKYCDMIVEFFKVEPYRREISATSSAFGKGGNTTFTKEEWKYVPNDLPTLTKFAEKIGVDHDTLLNWTEKYEEFNRSFRRAKLLYKDFLIENGLRGLYNSTFGILVATNTTDLKQKIEVEHAVSFVEAVRQAKVLREEKEKLLLQSG